MYTLLSWCGTILALPALLITLLVWHPLLVLTHSLHEGLHFWWCALGNRLLLLELLFTGRVVRAEGLERLPQSGPVVFISNHQGFFDIPLFLWFTRQLRPRFVAKRELGRGFPSASYVLRANGSALIDRRNAAHAREQIQAAAAVVRERKAAIVIFPEGTRSRDGVLRPFKSGGLRTLLSALPDATVVPVAIVGSWPIMSRRMLPVPFGGVVRFSVLEPLPAPAVDDIDQFIQLVQRRIGEAVHGAGADDSQASTCYNVAG